MKMIIVHMQQSDTLPRNAQRPRSRLASKLPAHRQPICIRVGMSERSAPTGGADLQGCIKLRKIAHPDAGPAKSRRSYVAAHACMSTSRA